MSSVAPPCDAEGDAKASSDPPCFPVLHDDSSRNVTAKNAVCALADELASTPPLAAADVVDSALARAIDAEVRERMPGWESRVALLASELRARRLAKESAVAIGTIRHESSG
jgi:hypothetical protein